MGPMRPARITSVDVQVSARVQAELPDGSGVALHNIRAATGGTVQDAAVTAAKYLDEVVCRQLDDMVAVIEGGVNADGELLWMEGGTPWDHEAWSGALVDADGRLWAQMDNWPGNQWLSPTGHGVREWEELVFPVKLAPPAWTKGLAGR